MDKNWQEALKNYLNTENFKELTKKVHADYLYKSKTVYPKPQDIFRAFNETPLEEIKVVILGQDPYHSPGQAHGLCFSVPEGTQTPPSLRNIFKEVQSDVFQCRQGSARQSLPGDMPTDLTHWATQGVFLLNAVLTVLKNQPASHSRKNMPSPGACWEEFTDHVIKVLSDTQGNVVFMLWGAYAQSKASLIDTNKHLVLKAPHPSPLSSYRGFFGCRHFSKANKYLKKHGKQPIKW